MYAGCTTNFQYLFYMLQLSQEMSMHGCREWEPIYSKTASCAFPRSTDMDTDSTGDWLRAVHAPATQHWHALDKLLNWNCWKCLVAFMAAMFIWTDGKPKCRAKHYFWTCRGQPREPCNLSTCKLLWEAVLLQIWETFLSSKCETIHWCHETICITTYAGVKVRKNLTTENVAPKALWGRVWGGVQPLLAGGVQGALPWKLLKINDRN